MLNNKSTMTIRTLFPWTRRRQFGQLVFIFPLLINQALFNIARAVDFEFPSLQIKDLAFGSCHKARPRKKHQTFNGHATKHAFQNIPKDIPVWIWTGDAVYPPKQGVASVELLRQEYNNMLTNSSLGYDKFIQNKIVLGTWDDHE
jgi:alkaline phosphatase D